MQVELPGRPWSAASRKASKLLGGRRGGSSVCAGDTALLSYSHSLLQATDGEEVPLEKARLLAVFIHRQLHTHKADWLRASALGRWAHAVGVHLA